MKYGLTEYKEVALLRDVLDSPLRAGYVTVLVDIVPHPAGGEDGAVLEVFDAIGESIAIVTVPCSAVAPLRADQMPTVRVLAAA